MAADLIVQLRAQLDAAQSDAAGALRNTSLAQETLYQLETELAAPVPQPEPEPAPEPVEVPTPASVTATLNPDGTMDTKVPDLSDHVVVWKEVGSPDREWITETFTRTSPVLDGDGRIYVYSAAYQAPDGRRGGFAEANAVQIGTLPTEPTPVEPAPTEPTPEPDPSEPVSVNPTGGTLDSANPKTGETLTNVDVTGKVLVSVVDDVHIHQVRMGAAAFSSCRRSVFEDFEIDGLVGEDGMHVTSSGRTIRPEHLVFRRFWVHNPIVTSTSHYDGMQMRGANDILFEDGLIDLGPHKPQYTAAFFIENANGGNQRITARRCTFLGGGYTLYLSGEDVLLEDIIVGGGRYGHLYPKSNMTGVTLRNVRDTAGNLLELTGAAGAWKLTPMAAG